MIQSPNARCCESLGTMSALLKERNTYPRVYQIGRNIRGQRRTTRTSSARRVGSAKMGAFAVLRLITNSNFVGCSTANFAFVESERENAPAPFGRHSACTSCYA